MSEELAGKTIFSDAVAYDRRWCQLLFDETPYGMGFTWLDFWYRVCKEMPSTIKEFRSYGAMEWRSQLKETAVNKLGIKEHLADNDVQIRMTIFRLAEQGWGPSDYTCKKIAS